MEWKILYQIINPKKITLFLCSLRTETKRGELFRARAIACTTTMMLRWLLDELRPLQNEVLGQLSFSTLYVTFRYVHVHRKALRLAPYVPTILCCVRYVGCNNKSGLLYLAIRVSYAGRGRDRGE